VETIPVGLRVLPENVGPPIGYVPFFARLQRLILHSYWNTILFSSLRHTYFRSLLYMCIVVVKSERDPLRLLLSDINERSRALLSMR
jgi:hypothetical protein